MTTAEQVSNQTCWECQKCGKQTNFAGSPHYQQRLREINDLLGIASMANRAFGRWWEGELNSGGSSQLLMRELGQRAQEALKHHGRPIDFDGPAKAASPEG